MTVKIYIWYPKYPSSSLFSAFSFKDVGHVSMQINGIYISHRPAKEYRDKIYQQEYIFQIRPPLLLLYALSLYKDFVNYFRLNLKLDVNKDKTIMFVKIQEVNRADPKNYTYDKECEERRRGANRIIEVSWLNENRMLEYYFSLPPTDLMYHPINKNCCTFIAKIIRSSLDCTQACNFCNFKDTKDTVITLKQNFNANLSRTISSFHQKNNLCLRMLNLYVNVVTFIPLICLCHIIYTRYYLWTPHKIERLKEKLELQRTLEKTCLFKSHIPHLNYHNRLLRKLIPRK